MKRTYRLFPLMALSVGSSERTPFRETSGLLPSTPFKSGKSRR